MELRCQLIDYEPITDESGRRLIFFSRFAGLAGAIDTLWALGRRLDEGLAPNPFAALEQTHRYPTLAAALAAVREVGATTPRRPAPQLCPFVIGITGYGNVSRGAQEVVNALGAVAVAAADLDDLLAGPSRAAPRTRSLFAEHDMVARRDARRPSRWKSTFDMRSCTRASSSAGCRA